MKKGTQVKKILIIPSIRKGNGTGHLRRTVNLALEFMKKRITVAILADRAGYRENECFSVDEIKSFLPGGRRKMPEIITETVASSWDLCIFDTRDMKNQRLSYFSGRTMTLGLDEGGEAREYFDYLIDVLPNLEKSEPNVSSTGFLQLPDRAEAERSVLRPAEKQFRKILITFGGEDNDDLTGKLLAMFDDTGVFSAGQITVVKGPLFERTEFPEGVTVLDAPDKLGEKLHGYDLIFTMFGITCFEALYSRVPVILFNPSQYHRSLSVRAGIPEIGVHKPEASKLEEYLGHSKRLERAVEYYSGISRINLADYISRLNTTRQVCRGCGAVHHRIIFRDLKHSFFRCSKCSLVNQMYSGTAEMSYGTEYFFDDYKKQYGRTYLEDFSRIKKDGLRRCEKISRLKKGGTLLDAGCGYGPFLAAADESGYNAEGLDVSINAAAWVNKELGYKVYTTPLENFEPEDKDVCVYDVVTMWYVIEHLQNPGKILDTVNSLLPVGGVFCFATPNFNGISRIRHFKSFFKANPLDHYTIWSLHSARRLLRIHGFSIKFSCCPTVHPERFFSEGVYSRIPGIIKPFLNMLISAFVKIFKAGDTFEVYAVKKR